MQKIKTGFFRVRDISENPTYFEEKLAKHNLLENNLESNDQKKIRDK